MGRSSWKSGILFVLALLLVLVALWAAGLWTHSDSVTDSAFGPRIQLVADATSAPTPTLGPAIPPQKRPGAPDLVLISVDTLRADHLGAYGHTRPTSPAIDRLAEDGIVFDSAFTSAPKTTPGLASLVTGLPVKAHGIYELRIPLDPPVRVLAEILKDHGYETGGFCGQFNCHRGWGFARGFDHYDDAFDLGDDRLPPQRGGGFSAGSEKRAGYLVDSAVDWIEDRRTKGRVTERPPFFAWLHLMDPHAGYSPPGEYVDLFRGASKFSTLGLHGPTIPRELIHPQARLAETAEYDVYLNRYDGEIRYADDQIGRLLDHLRRTGLYEDALIVVTADHGEYMGESSSEVTYFSHGTTLTDWEVKIPLVVKLPGLERAGTRCPRLISITDVMELILTHVERRNAEQDAASVTDGSDIVFFQSPHEKALFSARDRRHKLVVQSGLRSHELVRRLRSGETIEGRYRLYDLETDPLEREPLAPGHEKVAARLAALLAQWLVEPASLEAAPRPPRKTMEEDTERHLRALGYVD